MNPKTLSDDALYEYIYQSGILGIDIPKSRKAQVKLAKTLTGQWRINPVRGEAYGKV